LAKEMPRLKIGIIGCGNMGAAIAGRLQSDYDVFCFDKDQTKFSRTNSLGFFQSLPDLVRNSQVIILAVKPQDLSLVLAEIALDAVGKLVISIAAGVKLEFLENILKGARVIRVMPNLGALVGKSLTCLCKRSSASDEDLTLAEELFSHIGEIKVMEESRINSATAISGSSLAYIADFLETENILLEDVTPEMKASIIHRLEKAALAVGFNKNDSELLAVASTTATFELMKTLKPKILKEQVTSKGGTTEAALEAIHKTGSWEKGALAALKRAEELSKKE
jgi:pyrroline-5-carboxylate reductase